MLFLLGAPVTGVNVELGYAPHHRGGGVQGNRRYSLLQARGPAHLDQHGRGAEGPADSLTWYVAEPLSGLRATVIRTVTWPLLSVERNALEGGPKSGLLSGQVVVVTGPRPGHWLVCDAPSSCCWYLDTGVGPAWRCPAAPPCWWHPG